MSRAWILVEVFTGKNREAGDAIKEIEGVKDIDAVTSPYDFIVEVEVVDIYGITQKILHSKGVRRIVICVVVSSLGADQNAAEKAAAPAR